MALIQTEFLEDDSIALVRMTAGENRLNIGLLTLLNKELDRVERNTKVKVLITTGDGKFYSNGIDLKWMSKNQEKRAEFFELLYSTFQRVLVFPVITIAAMNELAESGSTQFYEYWSDIRLSGFEIWDPDHIHEKKDVEIKDSNGHAFAAGAMLSMAHDLRVMRTERGWFSLNEIFLKMRLPPQMMELVRCKIPSGPTEHFVFVFGKRFTAKEALEASIVNRTCAGNDLLSEARNLAKEVLGKQEFNREMLQDMKTDVYRHAVELLDRPYSGAVPIPPARM